jgi:hypothetical protein
VSSRRELISWLQGLTPNEAKALFDNHEQAALQPVLKMAESNGVIFLAYVKHVMNRIFVYPCDTQFPDSISFFLHISHSLYRHIREQKRLLHSALNVASLRRSGGIAEQKQDFGFLADEMESALKALEEDLRLLARDRGWISKFATLFLPISLLATILSISDPGYTKWAILGGLSVPFILISVYFMFFWKPAYFNSFKL